MSVDEIRVQIAKLREMGHAHDPMVAVLEALTDQVEALREP